MSAPRPHPWLGRVLAALSSRDNAQAATGDILEDLEGRRAGGHPPRRTAAWINLQMLRYIAAAVASASPRSLRTFGNLVRDAFRTLRRSPAHSLFILAILSVGLSAATTTFSVVDAVLFKPFPFERSDDLVLLNLKGPKYSRGLGPEQFWAIHDRVSGLESVAPYSGSAPIEINGVTETIATMDSTAEMFRVLRLRPLLGRLWTSDDEQHGETDVAVLSYAFWQRRFGGDEGTIGKTMKVRTQTLRIIGVLPREAAIPTTGYPTELWRPRVPVRVSPQGGTVGSALGRLRAGVTLPQVQAELEAKMPTPADFGGTKGTEWRVQAQQWDQLGSDASVKSWLWLLIGVVTLIVLTTCFNAANLMLTRSVQRAREFAVRASLGASRRQLVMSLVVESVLLSTVASVVGLVFAHWVTQFVRTAVPIALFRREEIGVDGRVFAAAAAAAIGTGVLFGVVPAFQASRVSIVSLLKDAAGTVTAARRRWRSAFLVSEIACIGILLVVSTLFIGSFVRVLTTDLGFDRSHLIGVSTITGYNGTVEDVRSRFTQIPGVKDVAAVGLTSLPIVSAFGGAYMDTPLSPVDGTSDVSVTVEPYRVSSNFFDVMGIPIARGSSWAPTVTGTGDFLPMVLEEGAARRIFGTRDPIGQQVRAKEPVNRVFTIVGLIPAVLPHGPEQLDSTFWSHDRPTAYYPINPTSRPSWVSMVVRTKEAPGTVVQQVETTYRDVAAKDASGGAGVHLFDDGFGVMTKQRRFNANLMSIFAIFALAIGAAGIYAVMASVVAQQTREIGVRVALGATPSLIRRGVLNMTARHVLIGLAIGLPIAWWIARGFATLFFQVGPADVTIYLVVGVTVLIIATVGSFVPARRASRVDPIISLRAEN